MNANTLYERAQLAIRLKRTEDAWRLLVDALKIDPNFEDAWLALASVTPDMNHAIECLNRVLTINPNNQKAHEWLTLARQEQARRRALTSILSDPEMANVLVDEPNDKDRAVPRLGRYLLDYKFITEDQLKAALLAQRRTTTGGQPRRLGDILLEQGALSKERLDFALREQHRVFFSAFDD